MTDGLPTLLAIADRAREGRGEDRVLDGLVFRRLFDGEGDEWSDAIGDEPVWHRRCREDRAAFDPPPRYSGSVDAVLALPATRTTLSITERTRPDAADDDWRPFHCRATVLNGLVVAEGEGWDMQRAVLCAKLRAISAVIVG